jgi:hypothetical protein
MVEVYCSGEEGVRGAAGCGWRGRRAATQVGLGGERWASIAYCPRCGMYAGSRTWRPPHYEVTVTVGEGGSHDRVKFDIDTVPAPGVYRTTFSAIQREDK